MVVDVVPDLFKKQQDQAAKTARIGLFNAIALGTDCVKNISIFYAINSFKLI